MAEADTPDALALKRPLPDDALRIVAKGRKGGCATSGLSGACTGSMRVDRRARVRDLRILDVEPIVPGEPEATLVLDRLAPVLSGASGAAAVDDAFGVGFDFNTHGVEAALGPASIPAEEIAGEIRLGWFLGHECPLRLRLELERKREAQCPRPSTVCAIARRIVEVIDLQHHRGSFGVSRAVVQRVLQLWRAA